MNTWKWSLRLHLLKGRHVMRFKLRRFLLIPLAVDPEGRKRLKQVDSSGRGKSEIGEVDCRVLFFAEVYLLLAYFSALCQCCTTRPRNRWNDVSVLGWTFLSAGVALPSSAFCAAKARNSVRGITSEQMSEIIVGMRSGSAS